MAKKYLTRPFLDIKKGTVPNSEYKSGKAVALLFALDYLTHQAEGQCIMLYYQSLSIHFSANPTSLQPRDFNSQMIFENIGFKILFLAL